MYFIGLTPGLPFIEWNIFVTSSFSELTSWKPRIDVRYVEHSIPQSNKVVDTLETSLITAPTSVPTMTERGHLFQGIFIINRLYANSKRHTLYTYISSEGGVKCGLKATQSPMKFSKIIPPHTIK